MYKQRITIRTFTDKLHHITSNDRRVIDALEPAYFKGVAEIDRTDLLKVSAKYPHYFIVVEFQDSYGDDWLEIYKEGLDVTEAKEKLFLNHINLNYARLNTNGKRI